MSADDEVIWAVRSLARELPSKQLLGWAAQLPSSAPSAAAAGPLVAMWAPGAGQHVDRFLRRWRERFPAVTGQALALALRAWVAATDEAPEIELTWSGPMPPSSNLRRTEQVLLQMIERAKKSLWIITYSAYDIEEVKTALQAAVARGVDVKFVLETEENGNLKGDPAKALGVGEGATVYVWPHEKRPVVNGKRGVLHAKAALRDDEELLITSANLTGYAMHLNIELGLALRGPGESTRLRRHMNDLIRRGDLAPAGDSSCRSP